MSQKNPYGNGAMTLFIVEKQNTFGNVVRFANDGSYAFCDASAYKCLEKFLDAFAGKNLNVILSKESSDLLPFWQEDKDIPVSFFAQPEEPEAVTPCFSRESSLAAAAAFKRAQDRTLSRLAAQNFMRWHQLYGYDKKQAQQEKAEIKYLIDNGVNSAEEDIQLLKEFYNKENIDDEKC